MAKNFWGNDKPGATTVDTLIGRQTEIHGDVRFSGGLHIDGKVIGKVVALNEKNATLSVSESGVVEGDVRAPTIVLNGQVSGDVHASERVELAQKARVEGNVHYSVVEMSAGAQLTGRLVHVQSQEARALQAQDTGATPITAAKAAKA